ncbi:hypothetical protein RSSM_06666 [Rhodopirellula sallentina SM41]|uniref:Uncharacterized protein n=1 Tax=Rhodopirellula sallentina SM41 TaxID=1263870 RepID=M5TRT8_9BACT|nr:hypothetical protein RSSM_06666 [Rhodopirellula sallentina SM41]
MAWGRNRNHLPHSCLRPSGDGTKPDFSRFAIGDYGNTLLFGDYEATVESILYEFDGDFRRRYRKNLRNTSTDFGDCLRRVRMQKELTQSSFPGVDAKTIERIESGKSKNVRKATKDAISYQLGVPWEDIKTF